MEMKPVLDLNPYSREIMLKFHLNAYHHFKVLKAGSNLKLTPGLQAKPI